MNVDHEYREDPLDYYYICSKCHEGKYHSLAGIKGRKENNYKIKPIPNLIKNLLKLKTRKECEELLKEVILKKIKTR